MDGGERPAKPRRFNDPPRHPQPVSISTHIPSIDLPLCASEHEIEAPTANTRYTSTDGICLPFWSSRYSNGVGEEDAEKVGLSEGQQDEQSELCYGMLSDIAVNLKSGLGPSSTTIPVFFQSPNGLSSPMHPDLLFEITCVTACRLLSELDSVVEVSTQLYCYSKTFLRKGNSYHERRRGRPSQMWLLNVIIYGTEDLLEVVGDHLSKHRMYLQDPVVCDLRVPYRNPHILRAESDDLIMSDSFNSPIVNLEIERLEAGPNLLAQLMEEETSLPETETPSIVKTSLFAHQKVALTFMIRREEGWALESGRDIWRGDRDAFGRIRYKNNVNGFTSTDAPPNFRGGLLADDMGLGKTLSMLSLIAYDQANGSLLSPSTTPEPHIHTAPTTVKTTLVVVPPPLIHAWQKQFELHLLGGTLKLLIYHGQNRKGVDLLGQYDVIITTYHTIATIWRQCTGDLGASRTVFSLLWHRVVLDEAHVIRNPHSILTKACCALRSEKRWAITGTPIQNRLADFASLLRFLQVHPYSDPRVFEEEISRPWLNADPQGFLRLKTLVRAITIGRSKTVVMLPRRIDETHHLNFSPAERAKYEAAKIRSRALLDEAVSLGNEQSKTRNALALLNVLRLICNHGLLAQNTLEMTSSNSNSDFGSSSQNPPAPSSVGDILSTAARCSNCDTDLLYDSLHGLPSAGTDEQRQLNACGPVLCDLCSSQLGNNKLDSISLCQVPIEHAVSMDFGLPTPANTYNPASHIERMSTKIKALIADICKHCAAEKSVVFSFWTHTLDLVQLMLQVYNIPSTRIDGKTSLAERSESLRIFKENEHVRAIVVSISCGGVGLDLTPASRVYLLEPQWNPMLEQQAICRVHRVGQTRDVTTIRYLMRDSFEEQIVEIQKRKRMLAQVTFGQDLLQEADIGIGTLRYLKSILE